MVSGRILETWEPKTEVRLWLLLLRPLPLLPLSSRRAKQRSNERDASRNEPLRERTIGNKLDQPHVIGDPRRRSSERFLRHTTKSANLKLSNASSSRYSAKQNPQRRCLHTNCSRLSNMHSAAREPQNAHSTPCCGRALSQRQPKPTLPCVARTTCQWSCSPATRRRRSRRLPWLAETSPRYANPVDDNRRVMEREPQTMAHVTALRRSC